MEPILSMQNEAQEQLIHTMAKTTSALFILSLIVIATLTDGIDAAGRGIPGEDEKDHKDLLYGTQHWFLLFPIFHPWLFHLFPWIWLKHDKLAAKGPLDGPPQGDEGHGKGLTPP